MNRPASGLRAPWLTKTLVTLFDTSLGALSMLGAIRWRYDFLNKPVANDIDTRAAIIFGLTCLIVWMFTRVHKAIWRFTSLSDIRNLAQAVLISVLITFTVLFLFFDRAIDFPRSALLIVGPLFFFLLTISRFSVVLATNGDIPAIFRRDDKSKSDGILIGSSASLYNYLRDMNRRAGGPGFNIKGLIDTDENHKGRSIRGSKVLGNLTDLAAVYAQLQQAGDNPLTLIVTEANLDKTQSYDIVKMASNLSAPLVRVNPGLPDHLTPFEASDLIGRNVRSLDLSPVRALIGGRKILVTGGGGTIGSELARQLAALDPEKLTLVDISEYNLYRIDKTLTNEQPNGPQKNWTTYLADIRDSTRIDEIFTREKPDIIFHAAAIKHVPMGEQNPVETLSINVAGTQVLLDMAAKHKVKSFTLISTDKAVDPSNMMGASKRLAEILTLAAQETHPQLSASAVRFGNVLASAGSVIPLFEEQIARGGPVTVTHKDVNRYFMTTEEAAALVLQSAAINIERHTDDPLVYVLEMGEPVNIARLARQLIRLRGFVPDRDIKIDYIGLREGEKLSEFLQSDDESLANTAVSGVQYISGDIANKKIIMRHIDDLLKAAAQRDRSAIKLALKNILPRFKPNGGLS